MTWRKVSKCGIIWFSEVWLMAHHHQLCTEDYFLLDSYILETERTKPFLPLFYEGQTQQSMSYQNFLAGHWMCPFSPSTAPSTKEKLSYLKVGFGQALGLTVSLIPSFQTSNQHENVASWPTIECAMPAPRDTNIEMDRGDSCNHEIQGKGGPGADSWVEWTNKNPHSHNFYSWL